ncbi:MAG TPA: response regulator [Anaerolineales bacterium]|nr:response regulator [Anaerolineales bacterium]HND49335.1 response regulator [Anaerolineales bacterium]HNE05505.1 response regulator [Anaerolineales bacterium]HNM36777.1 response regulator [Anaerolineales bacterium]HNO93214.1 response regulator [Anaerolineales bacterium]
MSQKKILIVDSDVASRNFIARKLQELDYETLQAGSGKEGLIYTWRDHPDLVIADPALTDIKGEEFATKLRNDPRTANLPIVALSSDHNPARIKSCQDAGFNDYITKSGQAVPMLKDIINRLFGVTQEDMKQGGLMIVFLSAKGGTGTSSVCANTAVNITKDQPEARIAVVDLVFPIGSIAQIVGYEGTDNIVTVADRNPLETDVDFLKTLPRIEPWNFNLLAGSPDPELSNQLNVGRIWDIITGLKSSYDYVLIDIGRSLSKITLPLIQHADLISLLISTDVSTISLTKTILDFLKSKGVKPEAIYTILNRHASLEGLSKREAETILEKNVNTAIPYLGTNFGFANSQHRPFTLKFPNDTASIIFHDSAREMANLAKKIRSQ